MGLKNTKNRLEIDLEDNTPLTKEELERFDKVILELQRLEHEEVARNPFLYAGVAISLVASASLMLNIFWNLVMVNIFNDLQKFTYIQALMVTTFVFLFITFSGKMVDWIAETSQKLLLRR